MHSPLGLRRLLPDGAGGRRGVQGAPEGRGNPETVRRSLCGTPVRPPLVCLRRIRITKIWDSGSMPTMVSWGPAPGTGDILAAAALLLDGPLPGGRGARGRHPPAVEATGADDQACGGGRVVRPGGLEPPQNPRLWS